MMKEGNGNAVGIMKRPEGMGYRMLEHLLMCIHYK